MVKDQHEKIRGYRDLAEEEIAAVNRIKSFEDQLGLLWHEVCDLPGVDARCLNHARTVLQDGFMWFVRGVARPESSFDS